MACTHGRAVQITGRKLPVSISCVHLQFSEGPAIGSRLYRARDGVKLEHGEKVKFYSAICGDCAAKSGRDIYYLRA